jgi:hypothetical protein
MYDGLVSSEEFDEFWCKRRQQAEIPIGPGDTLLVGNCQRTHKHEVKGKQDAPATDPNERKTLNSYVFVLIN